MYFADLKRTHGLGIFRLRGPYGARTEFILAETAQNLKSSQTISKPKPK